MTGAGRISPRKKPASVPQTGMTLHTAEGARKYLTAGERGAFLRTAEQTDRQVRVTTHNNERSDTRRRLK